MISKITSYLRFTKNALFTQSLRMSSVIGCVIMLCSAQPSASKDAIATTSFEDWSVFEDEVACWAASEAFQEPGADTSSEQHLMFVTFFYGVQIPEISFKLEVAVERLHTLGVTTTLYRYSMRMKIIFLQILKLISYSKSLGARSSSYWQKKVTKYFYGFHF